MGNVAPFPKNPAMRRAPDDELAREAAQGDLAAFDELTVRYERRAYSYALRMMGDPEAAREAAQEVFLKTWRNLPRFRGEAAFSTWFFTIVVSTCRNVSSYHRLRDRHRAPETTHEDAPDRIAALPDTRPGPERMTEKREIAALLARALNNLPEPQRKMLVLRDVNEFNYAEIAGILGCPEGTVKSRIARARLQMREELARLGYNGPGDET